MLYPLSYEGSCSEMVVGYLGRPSEPHIMPDMCGVSYRVGVGCRVPLRVSVTDSSGSGSPMLLCGKEQCEG